MPQNHYDEVTTIEHNGVKARITKRRSNLGVFQYSFQFFRSYRSHGDDYDKDTLWFNPRHMEAIQEILPKVAEAVTADQER